MRLDLVGTVLSALGLGLIVFGDPARRRVGLRPAQAGRARRGSGCRPSIWLIARRRRRPVAVHASGRAAGSRAAAEPLVDPAMLRNHELARRSARRSSSSTCCRPGCSSPCRCSCRSRSGSRRSQTGVRLLPLSITLLLAAAGIPKLFPQRLAAPRGAARVPRAVRRHRRDGRRARRRRRAGDRDVADAARRASASARWRRSSAPSPCRRCPTSRAGEVGGLQNTVTNLGASIGTALAGAVLIATLTTIVRRPASRTTRPCRPRSRPAAEVQLSGGVPVRLRRRSRDGARRRRRAAGRRQGDRRRERDRAARRRCATSLSILAVIALLALLFSIRIPREQPTAPEIR